MSTPARCTAAAVASAMWISGTPDAASTSSATRCIVLVQMTIACAPAVTRSGRRRPEPRRPLPVAGFLVRLDIGEVEGPDQQICGRHCAEPVADDPIDVAFVFDRGLPRHAAQQSKPSHGPTMPQCRRRVGCMHELPLAWRTDLAILEMSGAQVTGFEDYILVRSPDNPGYHWGNCILVTSGIWQMIRRDACGLSRCIYPALIMWRSDCRVRHRRLRGSPSMFSSSPRKASSAESRYGRRNCRRDTT